MPTLKPLKLGLILSLSLSIFAVSCNDKEKTVTVPVEKIVEIPAPAVAPEPEILATAKDMRPVMVARANQFISGGWNAALSRDYPEIEFLPIENSFAEDGSIQTIENVAIYRTREILDETSDTGKTLVREVKRRGRYQIDLDNSAIHIQWDEGPCSSDKWSKQQTLSNIEFPDFKQDVISPSAWETLVIGRTAWFKTQTGHWAAIDYDKYEVIDICSEEN